LGGKGIHTILSDISVIQLDCKNKEEKKLLALTNGSSAGTGAHGTYDGNKFLLKDKPNGGGNNDTGTSNSNSAWIKEQSMMVPDGHVETQPTNCINKDDKNTNSNTNTSDQAANGKTDKKLLPKLHTSTMSILHYS
jgi:hypothetical protein